MTASAKPDFSAWFRCAEGCAFRAPLTEVVYRCPRCQGLLEVEHDLDALRGVPASDWKAIFEAFDKDGYKEQFGLETHIFGEGQVQASHDSMREILRILGEG